MTTEAGTFDGLQSTSVNTVWGSSGYGYAAALNGLTFEENHIVNDAMRCCKKCAQRIVDDCVNGLPVTRPTHKAID